MKVLHLLSSNRYSGAENVACQIVDMFREYTNVDMIYCSPSGPIEESLVQRDISFYGISQMSLKEVRSAIRTIKPDVIHAHDMKASVIAAIECGNTPLVCHIHNNDKMAGTISLKSVSFLIALKKAKKIIWVSQSAKDSYYFKKSALGKSIVLPNIINIGQLWSKVEQDQEEYKYDVVFLGRLQYPKDPRRFAHIIEKMSCAFPALKAAMVGTGDIEIEESKNLALVGYMSNPYKLLYQSKVMLMTSEWEGTPMAALEAMTLGVPIVSTPVDGMKDLIINGFNGYLSDNDSELADYVGKIVSNDELRKRMSDNQIEKSQKINDADKYRKELLKIYEQSVDP